MKTIIIFSTLLFFISFPALAITSYSIEDAGALVSISPRGITHISAPYLLPFCTNETPLGFGWRTIEDFKYNPILIFGDRKEDFSEVIKKCKEHGLTYIDHSTASYITLTFNFIIYLVLIILIIKIVKKHKKIKTMERDKSSHTESQEPPLN